MRKKLVLVWCLCVLLSQGAAADTTVIAAFGDSLFSGYGVAREKSVPAQLEQKLKDNGYDVKVLNFGVAGDTSAGGVARLDQVLKAKPNIVIIEFGANDLLRVLPPAETKHNLTMIMDQFKNAHIRMILTGQKAPFTLGRRYADQYNDMYDELARAYGVPLYPYFLKDVFNSRKFMQADNMHPNKEGAGVIVNNLYPIVEKTLKKYSHSN